MDIIAKIFKKKEKVKEKQLYGYSTLLNSIQTPFRSDNFLSNSNIYQYYISSHLLYSVITTLREASLQIELQFNSNVNEKVVKNIFRKLPQIYTDMFLFSNVYFTKQGEYINGANVLYDRQTETWYLRKGEKKIKLINITIKDGLSPVIPLRDVLDKTIFLDYKERESIINWGGNGILSYSDEGSYGLTKEEFEVLNKKFKEAREWVGSGGILVVDKNMKYTNVGLTISDVNTEKIYVNLVRQIANAFGIDSSLLNDFANKTYANKKESISGLYINTVYPIVVHFWRNFYENFAGSSVINPMIDANNFVEFITDKIVYMNT